MSNNLPLTFRSAEARQVFAYLRGGDSCQVVGIGSSGKSAFLRLLSQQDFRAERYPLESGDRARAGWPLMVYIDANKLLRRSDWGLYELMLHQLLVELESCGDPDGLVETIDALHNRATEKDTEHLALRYLDRALALTIKKAGHPVVFLLDEFDQLSNDLPPACFAALRALRDDHKTLLMYITATRRLLADLRRDSTEIESFTELFSGSVVWLGVMSEVDAREMIQRRAGRYGVKMDETRVAELIDWTGCHPGLLRGAIRLAVKGNALALEKLVNDPAIQEECQQIWRSLPVTEQRALGELAVDGKLVTCAGLEPRLQEKGLVRDGRVFAPLFKDFILQVKPVAGALVEIDRQQRKVWVRGREIKDLTAQEFNCLDYLAQRRGQVCRPEEIGLYCYEAAHLEIDLTKRAKTGADEKVFGNGIEALIKRLRRKVESSPEKPTLIVNVRGVGYKLEDGGDNSGSV